MTTTTLPAPCWHLEYPNGAYVDTGDSIPHFRSDIAARVEARRHNLHGVRPKPVRLDASCVTAASVCGRLVSDGEHYDCAEDALQSARDGGWTVLPDGRLLCDSKSCACREVAP